MRRALKVSQIVTCTILHILQTIAFYYKKIIIINTKTNTTDWHIFKTTITELLTVIKK